jgi:DNA-binding FadR family transcriptional regulator
VVADHEVMTLEPIARAAVSDQVFTRLVDGILGGGFAPGDPLPSERELAETFQVNRHAIREAMKRLSQSGLVLIAQGGKTRVLDWRTTAGLDVLVALVRAGTVPPKRVLHDVAEMRLAVGSDAAALCALRATEEQRAAVTAAAAAYSQTDDLGALMAADAAFWYAVIDGCANLAYRLGMNTLVTSIIELGPEHLLGFEAELADRAAHEALAEAVAAGDAEKARALSHDLLSGLVAALS